MTAQMFWLIFAAFVLGLFVGSNMGIMLLCVLQVAGKNTPGNRERVPVPAEAGSRSG